MFAVNAKGRSEPTIIDDITFKGVAKYTGKHTIYSIYNTHLCQTFVVAIPIAAVFRKQPFMSYFHIFFCPSLYTILNEMNAIVFIFIKCAIRREQEFYLSNCRHGVNILFTAHSET